jgi:hypothetical protein
MLQKSGNIDLATAAVTFMTTDANNCLADIYITSTNILLDLLLISVVNAAQ